MTTARVLHEWQNRVTAEYRSAALTAQLSHWMIQAALDDALLHTALRIVRDELDHARLCHACLVALGGDDAPEHLDIATLREPDDEGVLASLVDSIGKNFCLGETLAVPLFDAMRRHTTHPAAQPVLRRVLQDEAIHRAFGWEALDALLALDPDGVRARVGARLPAWLDGFREAYAPAASSEPLTDDERAAGLLDLDDYREVFWGTVRGDIRRRMSRRGIPLPEAYG